MQPNFENFGGKKVDFFTGHAQVRRENRAQYHQGCAPPKPNSEVCESLLETEDRLSSEKPIHNQVKTLSIVFSIVSQYIVWKN